MNNKIDSTISDAENPEWSDDMFAHARRGPAAALKARGRPKSEITKVQKTLRLSPDVIEFFQAGGKGWQTRIDDVLKEYVKSHQA
ncbi:BrnA antitoxin family protein [Bacterioplanoides sp.]|uniref:BrnA antitoxin family protein n=1 Tax=Bacterioplanoides sp. TaxID=2066072 RepID=UPI003B005A50